MVLSFRCCGVSQGVSFIPSEAACAAFDVSSEGRRALFDDGARLDGLAVASRALVRVALEGASELVRFHVSTPATLKQCRPI